MEDFTKIDGVYTFKNFIRVNKEEMILLGAPVVRGIAQNIAIKNKINDLSRMTSSSSTHQPQHVKPLTFCTKKYQTLFHQNCSLQTA